MIKLIAIDLDGTLFDQKGNISTANKQMIKEAKSQDVKVVICTGRPLAAIRHILEELELVAAGDYSITFNGGLIQENATGEVLKSHAFLADDVRKMHEVLHQLQLPLDVISDDTCYHVLPVPTDSKHQSIYESFNARLNYAECAVMDLPKDRMYNKMVVPVAAKYLDQQLAMLPTDVKNDYTLFKSRPALLEIMPNNVDKASGLADLGQILSIDSSEMMAIGDEENDLSMIAYAGLGIAMGNAVDKVKEIANFVTATNQEDGVAKAIKKFAINQR